MQQCSQCGHQNSDDAKFCSQCGQQLGSGQAAPADVTATITFGAPGKTEPESSAPVGSSAKTTPGLATIARAIATRCA